MGAAIGVEAEDEAITATCEGHGSAITVAGRVVASDVTGEGAGNASRSHLVMRVLPGLLAERRRAV